ncbi:uncharacterized protein LOC119689701 [Teleopsis dalmanni]|uniref:uncharacterized protein LOC119689701 n=1 Tax=Teleopsis dalmanni TaxID=139649 RepID=UPI0018CFD3A6|nr:uncharacterized protein LOC119689701 [Teleopsis dalmanni]
MDLHADKKFDMLTPTVEESQGAQPQIPKADAFTELTYPLTHQILKTSITAPEEVSHSQTEIQHDNSGRSKTHPIDIEALSDSPVSLHQVEKHVENADACREVGGAIKEINSMNEDNKPDSEAALKINSSTCQSLICDEIQTVIKNYQQSQLENYVDSGSMQMINGLFEKGLQSLAESCQEFFSISDEAFKKKSTEIIKDNSASEGDFGALKQSEQSDLIIDKVLNKQSDKNCNEKVVTVLNTKDEEDPQLNSIEPKETNGLKNDHGSQTIINNDIELNEFTDVAGSLTRLRHYETTFEISRVDKTNNIIEHKLFKSDDLTLIRKLVFDLHTGVRLFP